MTVSAHDGREIVRALQCVRSLRNAVLDPLPPVLRDRRGQFRCQAEFSRIAIDAGQAFRLRYLQPAVGANVRMSPRSRTDEKQRAIAAAGGNPLDVLVGMERAHLP